MNKIIALFLILSIITLTGQGCTEQVSKNTDDTTISQADIADIESGLDEINELDSELDTSDLDNLDQELDEVTW